MDKPDVKDFDFQPYGYIHALLEYIEYLEEQLKTKNTDSYPESEIEYISIH